MQQQTSQEALQAVKSQLPSLRTLVLNFVTACGERGATSEDLYHAYPKLPQSSLHARLSELQVRGKVSHHGFRRNTRGRKMIVWVANESRI
jgi:hypothetical protein